MAYKSHMVCLQGYRCFLGIHPHTATYFLPLLLRCSLKKASVPPSPSILTLDRGRSRPDSPFGGLLTFFSRMRGRRHAQMAV